jgi:hypothetical protein
VSEADEYYRRQLVHLLRAFNIISLRQWARIALARGPSRGKRIMK